MRKFGVKVWSKDVLKNRDFFQQCVAATKEGGFSYIELFALPGSYQTTAEVIASEMKGLPVVIHAPHSGVGMDMGNDALEAKNREMFRDSQLFADLLNADTIILHPGIGQGARFVEESIRQFKQMADSRIIVENQPYDCCVSQRVLHGITPQEIKLIQQETGCGFCLDFYHAICAANSLEIEVYAMLDDFKSLKPVMYHLCDGDIKGKTDDHLHFGEGNFDLGRFLRDYVQDGSRVTLETGREVPQNVQPWLDDLAYIQQVEAEL